MQLPRWAERGCSVAVCCRRQQRDRLGLVLSVWKTSHTPCCSNCVVVILVISGDLRVLETAHANRSRLWQTSFVVGLQPPAVLWVNSYRRQLAVRASTHRASLFSVYALISSLVLEYHDDCCQAPPGCICKQQPEDFTDHKRVPVHIPRHTRTHEPKINI